MIVKLTQKLPADEPKDQGSILLLLIGLCAILLLVASVVTGVTGVYLEKQKLQALADQTASSAVQNFAGLQGERGKRPTPVLTSEKVSGTSQEFLAQTGAYTEFDGLQLVAPTGISDTSTAQVGLVAVAHPPLVSFIVPNGVPISVESSARITVNQ
jgi:hypothetical protein